MVKKRSQLSDEIRKAVRDSDLTRYRIWKETGIDQSRLSRFVSGEAGLTLEAIDRLSDLLDLHIMAGQPCRRSRRQQANKRGG